jgi:hypothetical protein
MLKAFLHSQIGAYEKSYGYDATYFHEIVDASPLAFFKFALFQVMSNHRDGVPKDAWFAARIAAALSEDCGPCTQLVVNMALRQKVPAPTIAALLRGDFDAAGADAALGFRYGMAVAANSADAVTLSEQAERRFGKRGLVSLAFAVTSARVYPCLKRGLGHGAACTKITVLDETILVKRAA